MRVSQQMLFSRYIHNLNTSLTSLLDLNTQAQTQKKINKPSDDPTGMTRILDHRDTLRSLEQYSENISTAKGWLGASDEALRQISTLITRAKELAGQAATGTVSGDNREQVSYELRSIFEQMVGLANSEFEGKSLYAGQKVDGNAYEQIMWLTTNDTSFGNTDFTVLGSSDTTVLVQFYDTTGATAVGGNMDLSDPNLGVRYSIDGGRSWQSDGAVSFAGGQANLSLPSSGTSVIFHSDATVKVNDPDDPSVADGTWLWVRPSARYIGDDKDAPPKVDKIGVGSSTTLASASGSFLSTNVVVRIDNEAAVAMNGDIQYSYSLNGGVSWVTGNVAQADTSSNASVLSIANGGILTITSNGGNTLQPGQQFVIRPRSADINLDISASQQVRVNDVGKDIFGGIYMDPDAVLSAGGSIVTLGSLSASRVFSSNGAPTMSITVQGSDEFSKNLFEVMGNLVAFAETNNQTGVQQMLENLTNAQSHIMNKLADVGGRENRLTVTENILTGLKFNEEALLSSIEDADVSELMTDLVQQQMVYEAVLRSTSMIMQLNLTKFI
ncbi:MAG: flagellar hook-associated protein FlgL [Pseudodesulfovibrio sp.]|uniref:Flagellar hook-associated protein 3 n=2 Tax=Pseudodesulfovibrio aespoeensis TaxID=182210 RepID=E6VS94_PSEA9|nr:MULTISPECIES: flagellar hook-associated protein FlgL [Pseudodesulfovibrio]MBU4378885.1 flagellar hook-associated protein FlgL [Pseudomonadota bacterium]ADU63139.1 flagellar hook-associated protein 3 [Pseudodesulfovibrio aespoeensis Aspo-2]MBU4516849.1 flagellar hook-associated protein FlgL [Pseudomonadota bacterium]MBU4523167.1 flagellar hook-associated protein FlgL [Pseudomonadota bacterium]MBU4560184.1 flagellar hook-associated protein FlgL [Pseudomonadota bacterium]